MLALCSFCNGVYTCFFLHGQDEYLICCNCYEKMPGLKRIHYRRVSLLSTAMYISHQLENADGLRKAFNLGAICAVLKWVKSSIVEWWRVTTNKKRITPHNTSQINTFHPYSKPWIVIKRRVVGVIMIVRKISMAVVTATVTVTVAHSLGCRSHLLSFKHIAKEWVN